MKCGIVGATGAVGKVLFELFSERTTSLSEIRAFASPRSKNKIISLPEGLKLHPSLNRSITVQTLSPDCFKGLDVVFFDASDEVSREWVPEALRTGARVIDNSSVYRMNPEVPLVVPEVNGHLLNSSPLLIAGPNCTTAQLVMALKPLHEAFGLKKVWCSTYQSVSGAGLEAIKELEEQTLNSKVEPKIFQNPIAFNCIPKIGGLSKEYEGYTSEEIKVIFETRKILNLPNLPVMVTAVRVPVIRGHSEVVTIEVEQALPDLNTILQCLNHFSGLQLCTEIPTPLQYAHTNPVYVGRVRKDFENPHVLHFWIVADNLRKGAALNALQIAEKFYS